MLRILSISHSHTEKMQANNNSYDLFTFSNELFQNCFIETEFYQWNHHLTLKSGENSIDPLTPSLNPQRKENFPRKTTAPIWIDQPFDIHIKIYPPKGYHGSLQDFQSNWLNALQSMKIDYKLSFNGNTIPCYSKQHHDHDEYRHRQHHDLQHTNHAEHSFDRLLFHSFSKEESVIIFAYSTIISTDSQYLNEVLSFELTLEIILPKDLPFNSQLITDSQELKIRMLLDKNRHSPRECPRHALVHPICLIQPIIIQTSSIELNSLHSLLIVTIANTHEEYSVLIEQLQFHIAQTMPDIDKIFDILPNLYDQQQPQHQQQHPQNLANNSLSHRQWSQSSQNLQQSTSNREAVMATLSGEEVGTVAQESYSSQQGCYLTAVQQQKQSMMNNQLFHLFPLQYQENYRLLPYQEVRMIYQVSIQEEYLTAAHLQQFFPFGHFRTPLSLYWSPAPSFATSSPKQTPSSLCSHEVLHSSVLPWSIGTTMMMNATSLASSITPALLRSVVAASAPPTANSSKRALTPTGKSPFDKLVENGLLSLPPFISAVHDVDSFTFFQMEIEGPRVVKLLEEFSLTLILFNRSNQYSFTDVIISIDSATDLSSSG